MDPQLYIAAQSGNWDVIKQFETQLNTELTPQRNSVLHVLAQFCDSSFAVEQILQRQPELLLKSNENDQTALHIAARKGHLNVVRALIVSVKHSEEELWSPLLCSRSKIGNLALHEAVQSNHCGIVEFLVEEDPTLLHKTNNANESPLYLAVEKGYHSLAALMLSSLVKPRSSEIVENLGVLQIGDGPDFKSVLHAAAIQNCKDCTEMILEKLPHLRQEVDKFGWTPLHYAARFNHLEVARQLLNSDGSMANVKYKRNAHSGVFEEKTALHVAVTLGHLRMVEEILLSCPNCWEIVTDQGKNIIHLAVENEERQVLDLILGKSWASKLINQNDIDGNTPLHLYATAKNLLGCNLTTHPDVDRNALNNAGLTPLILIKNAAEQMRRKQTELENAVVISKEEDCEVKETNGSHNCADDNGEVSESKNLHNQKRMFDNRMLVATLIFTISYAAALTIPGGFDTNDGPEKGLAVLKKKSAFTAYVVCIVLAMIYSWMPVLVSISIRYEEVYIISQALGVGLVALMIAFVTGLYATIPVRGIRIFIILLLIVSLLIICGIIVKRWNSVDELLDVILVPTTEEPILEIIVRGLRQYLTHLIAAVFRRRDNQLPIN